MSDATKAIANDLRRQLSKCTDMATYKLIEAAANALDGEKAVAGNAVSAKSEPTIANMTLRDYFAGQAFVGVLNWGVATTPYERAKCAYAQADAMLRVRAEVKP